MAQLNEVIMGLHGYNGSGAGVLWMYKHTRELTCRMKLRTLSALPAPEAIAHTLAYYKDCQQWL